MPLRVTVFSTPSPNRRFLRVRTSGPLALLAIVCALACLGLFATTGIKFVCQAYFPYEGTVLRIGKRRDDHLAFEFPTGDHLIIETPGGDTIDRLVSLEVRLPSRIAPGDYVVKQRGFRNAVRPRDKKTNQEIIDAWQAAKRYKE